MLGGLLRWLIAAAARRIVARWALPLSRFLLAARVSFRGVMLSCVVFELWFVEVWRPCAVIQCLVGRVLGA